MKVITFMLLTCALATTAHAQETKLRGFSVVLLLGEQTGSIIPPKGLSPSAQRAIADIKEFLPYKSYRVLDTQWAAGSEYGTSKGRIRGLDQKDYAFELATNSLSHARFILVSPAMATPVLDNAFAIKPGETVVVGTSRVQGDSALIVLLTAVAADK